MMRLRLGLGFVAVLYFALPFAQAETPAASSAWSEAKALVDAGKSDDAIQLLRSRPSESAAYFYNLGSLYLRQGRTGTGLAYLEKAHHLKPYDSDIQVNLRVARESLEKTLGRDRIDSASGPFETLADRVSIDEVRGVLGLVVLILLAIWTRAYLRTRSLKRTLFQPAGAIAMFGLVLSIGIYSVVRDAADRPPAFLIEHDGVRSGPGNTFLELTQVESGTKVRVLSASDDGSWQQVRYGADAVGWIHTSSLLFL